MFIQLVIEIQLTSKSMYNINISKLILDSPSFLSLQTYGTVYRLPKDFKNSSSVKLLKTRLHSTSKASYQATYVPTYHRNVTMCLLKNSYHLKRATIYCCICSVCMYLYLFKRTIVNWDISPVTVSCH